MTNFYAETDVALDALSNHKTGLVEAATGTGKGVLIECDASKYFANNKGTVVVVGHRILLVAQLMERITQRSIKTTGAAPFKRIGVHSGGMSSIEAETLKERIALQQFPDIMCPSVTKLDETLSDSVRRGVSNAIYVTYHSLEKVLISCAKLGIRPRVYFDEIHTAAGDKNKWTTVTQMCLQSDYFYAFSATVDKYRKKIEETFGKRIYHLPADQAIARGLICKPVWMLAEVDGSREKNLAQGVVQAFIEHNDKNMFDAKALVNCKDTKDIVTIATSTQIKDLYSLYKNFMLAEISSERGCIINNIRVDRSTWIKTVNNHTGHLMVLHIDICNAGIDVPGFNLPMWTYLPGSETYTIQGNGRGARLSIDDREKLERQEITVADRSKWNKPYNTVCLLVFNDTIEEDVDGFVEFIFRSRSQGFEVTDLCALSKNSGKLADPFDNKNNILGTIQALQAQVDISLEEEAERNIIESIREMSSDERTDALMV